MSVILLLNPLVISVITEGFIKNKTPYIYFITTNFFITNRLPCG